MITPKKIRKGDTIGFISPSAGLAPFAMHRIEKAKAFFERQGYKVKFAKNSLKNDGYVSSSIKDRVDDIHELFSDESVSAIICTIGGNHSNQIIKYLDYDLINKNPKILIGYSDITVLHNAINKKAGLTTYYGPCVMTQFGENPEPLDYTWEYFKKILIDNMDKVDIVSSENWTEEILNWFSKEDLSRERKQLKNEGHLWINKSKSQGNLWGGCIPSLNHLLGTPFWRDPKNSIFLIDIPEGDQLDKGLSISNLDSYLADLDNIGVFDKINGIIVGRPYHYSEDESKELTKIISKYTKGKDYPIVLNVNIGHTDPIATFPYGAEVLLDGENNKISIILSE